MKKSISLLTVSVISILAFLFYYGATQPTEAIRIVNNPPQKQDPVNKEFEPARKMLREAGVPFDPDILLSSTWEKQIGPALSLMPEMQTSLRLSNKLRGVQIADTIVLPEKVELTGDLLILTNTLVLEGRNTEITGVGKNVYVFPVTETFHIGKSFENAMKQKGVLPELIPAANKRTYEKVEFDRERPKGIITITVKGQGHQEWQNRYKGILQDGRNLNDFVEEECTHLRQIDCRGGGGALGPEGTGGTGSGNIAPPPRPGSDGHCGRREGLQNGISGPAGDDGATGPNSAGQGGEGGEGGKGGTIFLKITGPYDNVYVFDARGGQGGQGGPGGMGAPGDPGQKGGFGGYGADCPCNQGGAGNGSDGTDGGRGGQGGRGGTGGPGGAGGRGGVIRVEYPYDFDQTRIAVFLNGGPPGTPGEGGLGGFSGMSGEGGEPGRANGNTNCPTTFGTNGRPGIQPAPIAPSERGPVGQMGTVTGDIGQFLPRRLLPTSAPGGCGGMASYSVYPGTGCAPGFINSGGMCTRSPAFISACNRFSGYDSDSCGCAGSCDPSQGGCSPIVVDILGNGFAMTSGANGVMFDLQANGTPIVPE